MNLLLLCTAYSLEHNHSWLSDSLAEQLALRHKVTVVLLDWSGKHKNNFRVQKNGVDVLVFSTDRKIFLGAAGKIFKWLFASRLISSVVKKALAGESFDLIVNITPALVMHPIYSKLKTKFSRGYLVLWDFFPIYHFELGLIPKCLFLPLKYLENAAYHGYDRLGLMSAANVKFLKSNYDLRSSTTVEVLNLWGPNEVLARDEDTQYAARLANNINDELVCVFGGQLIRGRGIGKIIELAIYAKKQGLNAKFFIFGDGPEREKILADIIKFDVAELIVYKGFKPREEYLDFLRCADLGLVFNSGDVSVPTFPSKAVDYLRSAVPILSFVEDATDFGEILQNEIRAGWSASPKNESRLFAKFSEAAKMEKHELLAIGTIGQNWYLDNMTVSKVAEQISACVDSSAQ